eukprot:1534036-Pyramimonas_sp.AAC.1
MQSPERDMVEKLFASREVDCKGVGKVQVYTTSNMSQLETKLCRTSLEDNLRVHSRGMVTEPGAVTFTVVPAKEAVKKISCDLRAAPFTV